MTDLFTLLLRAIIRIPEIETGVDHRTIRAQDAVDRTEELKGMLGIPAEFSGPAPASLPPGGGAFPNDIADNLGTSALLEAQGTARALENRAVQNLSDIKTWLASNPPS